MDNLSPNGRGGNPAPSLHGHDGHGGHAGKPAKGKSRAKAKGKGKPESGPQIRQGEWVNADRHHPCPICRDPSWCGWVEVEGGILVRCMRTADPADDRYRKSRVDSAGQEGHIYILMDDESDLTDARPGRGSHPRRESDPDDQDLWTRAYTALVEGLGLADEHRAALLRRGLVATDIAAGRYRTMPPADRRHHVADVVREASKLTFTELGKVPGFARDEHGYRLLGQHGLAIPVTDAAGRVVAVRIRPDTPIEVEGKVVNKYVWLSSPHGGPRVRAVAHVPPSGPGPHERVRVTEGEIKAHVATALSGTPTVSLPGAGMWGLALPALDALGAWRVALALDADHRTNPHVAAALAGAYRGLGERFAVALETWDGPKGIDDLLASGDQPEVIDGEDAERYLARLAKRHDQGGGRDVAAGLAQDARDPRVDIDITADYHLAVDQSAAALVGHPDVYERARALVIVHRQEQDDPDDALGVKRSAGAPLITPLTNVTARTLISRRARFWGYDRRENVWVRRSPPRDVAEAVIGLGGYPGGRELTGIVESPTIRPDGSLLARPGYDPATGLLYLPNAEYPEIPDAPTLGDAQRAVGDLLYLVTDFPFRGDPDQAAWLALVLTLIARGAIVGPTPAFLVSANVAASGKSILVSTAGRLATGRPPAFDGYAVDDVEMEKRLSAVALAGDPLFLLDNAENGSAVGGPSLDRAIMIQPGGAFRARILGKTEMSPMVPWRTVIAITGNNLSTKDDALRRFVPCFLLSTMERPETRDPAHYAITRETGLTLDEYVMRERPRLVAAALTILRAYVAAGSPRPEPRLTPMDFPKWELTVRRAIHYATGTDPCGSKSSLEANDETTLERRRVVAAWRDLCVLLAKPGGLTVREAADEMNAAPAGDRFKEVREAFPKALRPGTTQVDTGKLGYILRRHRDAVTPCGTLTVDGERHNIAIWKVSPP